MTLTSEEAPSDCTLTLPGVDHNELADSSSRLTALRRGPLADVVGSETAVPLADGTATQYANLDIAASAPALRAVADRVDQVLPWYASVHRGAGYLSQVSTSLYEAARERIGAFVGARPGDLTVIVRNTTDAINLLGSAVPGAVLVLDVEHHANLLPWRDARHGVTTLPAPATVEATLDALAAELRKRPYALLAVTGGSNVTGESLPLREVTALAHAHGARVFVDAAQLAPHRRFSISDLGVDYVALSGHKLYAPYGAGALIGRTDWLDAAPAVLAGGGAVARVGLTDVLWQPGPARHEAGSPNVIGAVALATAAAALESLGDDQLAAHDHALRSRLIDGLAQFPQVRVARIWEDSADPVGVVTFSVGDLDPGLVASYLSAEHGIGVRDGRFCAHPLLDRLGLGDGAVRASVGVGSTSDHVDRLLTAIEQLVSQGPRYSYEVQGGAWVLANDHRPLPIGLGLDDLVATAAAACGQLAPTPNTPAP